VLGIRKPEAPREDFGGILGDEMGLGKTLSMLSSIFVSLKIARAFADNWAAVAHHDGVKPATRATLIVVPSAREYSRSIDQVDLVAIS
jgi:SNF2 family DNA or RNA helicase